VTAALRRPGYLLIGLVFGAVVVRTLLNLRVPSPHILPDEVIYAELAERLQRDGELVVDNQPPNFLYSILIAPAWALGSVATAYEMIQFLNAILVALSAVPAYLWARRLCSPTYALVAAGLSLLPASLALSMSSMTENLLYPLFVLAGYTLALALERPTIVNQVLVFVVVGIACATRLQAAVLLIAVPTAILVKVLLDSLAAGWPNVRRALPAFWPTAAALAVFAVAYAGLSVARGRSFAEGLGNYQGVALADYSAREVIEWAVSHLGELVFAVGVLPACALVVLLGRSLRRRGPADNGERAYLAVASAFVLWIGVQSGFFGTHFSGGWIIERYTFYVAPVLFVGLAAWLGRGLPRPPSVTAAAGVVAAGLLLAVPFETAAGPTLTANVLTLASVLRLSELLDGGMADVRVLLAAGVLVAIALFAAVPRRVAVLAVPVAVAGFLALASWPVYGAMRGRALELETFAVGSNRTWIDDQVNGRGDAAFLYRPAPAGQSASHVLMVTQFWNRSIRSFYNFGERSHWSLPETALTLDRRTGAIVEAGSRRSPPEPFVVVHRDWQIAGELVAEQPALASPLALYQAEAPLRVAGVTEGLFPDGWAGSTAAHTRYVGGEGAAQVLVSRRAWGGQDVPGRVTIETGPLALGSDGQGRIRNVTARRTWTIHANGERRFRIPVPAAPWRMEVRIDPTFSPAQFGVPDARQLGAQVAFGFAQAD
jgi:Dolichyl-phosphate-mannose-protein mannosyltransferase